MASIFEVPSDLAPFDVKTALADGIAVLETQLQTTFVWAELELPCAGGPEFGGKKLDIGGFRPVADVRIKVRIAVFPGGVGLPQEKQTIQYRRAPGAELRKLRIDSITQYWDVALELSCIDPSQGA